MPILMVTSMLIIIFTMKKTIYKVKSIEVNHYLLFGIGFIYYYIYPILYGYFQMGLDNPVMKEWYTVFSNLTEEKLKLYCYMIFFLFLSFVLGDLCSNIILPKKETKFSFEKYNSDSLKFLSLICIVGSIFFIFQERDVLFRGYATGKLISGGFISLSLVLLGSCFLYNIKKIINGEKENKLYFFIYFFISIIIMSAGGRLYFLSSIIMYFVYKSLYKEKTSIKRLLVISFIIIFIMGVIGVVRIGNKVSLESILFILSAESIFTSISLVNFIDTNLINLDFMGKPIFLLSDFSNLIPSVLFKEKSSLLINPSLYGFKIYNPMGALNSFVSIMVNFGLFGSFIFIFILAFFMGKLKRNRNISIIGACYVMLSGWIGFSFFRDPFSVSIVKLIFEFSILIPFVIYIILKLDFDFKNKKRVRSLK